MTEVYENNRWNLDLLSPEKIKEVLNSLWIDGTKISIENYINDILPGWRLSDIAQETWVDIRVVIILSNYADNAEELLWAIQANFSPEQPWEDIDISILQSIIRDDFEKFEIWNAWEIQGKYQLRLQDKVDKWWVNPWDHQNPWS